MEDMIVRIEKKVEEVLHAKVDHIEKLENVPNNSVYKIFVKDRPYIFKIYRQRDWPEDGKLAFINQKLIEHQIGCAKLIAFDRSDPFFQNGYLLEECLPGVTADQMSFDSESGKEFYKQFACLVSKIHQIPIVNYGYIGSGIACCDSFLESMDDKYDEIANALINKKLFDEKTLLEIKKSVLDRLRLCEGLPSVLNHGDLSTKNVMIDNQGELTLIDWDDAMSYNWIADISRMTYWMKFYYTDYEYEMYRNAFLEHYITDSSIRDFNVFENTFHVWIGLDHLNYETHQPLYENRLAYFKETVEKL
ncbi:aminoglycoside phosphotransferase family protein [Gorillibacterium timonense]|uniref:aminoglycoside phosphotransferase family protein n=1 Tax=Gorillibacterium timonense TaxID=1689269 RepID=UPI00071CC90F|nr:aminoglycoside phosphotransferase family protein [Gorillibacterium timonense]